jgi:hypothetical protein
MTVLDVIMSLRPVGGSSREISAAIERARIALANADEAVTAAQQEHDAAVLDTDPSRFPDALKKLGKSRLDAAELREKVSAVQVQLEARLPIAKRLEAEDLLATKRQKAEAAGLALAQAWETTREDLASPLRALERSESAYAEAQRDFASAAASVSRAYPEMDISPAKPTGRSAFGWREDVNSMTQPVRKPFVQPADPDAAEREERQRIATANYVPHDQRPNAHGATPAWPN